MKRETLRLLVDTAREQGGLLDATDVGAVAGRDGAHQMLASGLWRTVLPGVLGPAAVCDSGPLLEAAAMLWAPRATLTHSSSARHLGIWVPDDDQVWVTTPWTAKQRDVPQLRLLRTRAPELEFLRKGLLRFHYAERTLLDLSLTLTRAQLEASLLSAVRLRRTTAADVAAAAARLRSRPGVSTLIELTELWSPERESLLEDRLYEDVCLAAPDEVVERQVVVGRRGGGSARLDVAIRRLRLGFEADGLFWHSSDTQIAADQARDRDLMVGGWQTARFREDALAHRPEVRRQVRALVARRRDELAA